MKTYCWCASSIVSDKWIAFLAWITPLFRGIMSDDLSVGRIRPPSSRIDIEAVRRERNQSLKNSRAGHLGHLNRLYKEIESLMQNVKNIGEACERKENLDVAFARCLQSYDDYYQYVEDVEMKKEALDACHSIITRKKEFDEHFLE